jgi:hypothetical protein
MIAEKERKKLALAASFPMPEKSRFNSQPVDKARSSNQGTITNAKERQKKRKISVDSSSEAITSEEESEDSESCTESKSSDSETDEVVVQKRPRAMTDYERQREEQVAQNKKLLEELKVDQACRALAFPEKSSDNLRKGKHKSSYKDKRSSNKHLHCLDSHTPQKPSRRSGRIASENFLHCPNKIL